MTIPYTVGNIVEVNRSGGYRMVGGDSFLTPVQPESEQYMTTIAAWPKSVARSLLITGGTGSLGSALAHRLKDDPRYDRVVIFSRDWAKQKTLRESLNDHPKFRWFIGDVRDLERLRLALRGIDRVIHAAAHKEIVSAEYNPVECLLTNCTGTQNVLQAALDCHVERVLTISSDKSCNPANFYGATKLVAERLTIAMNAYAGAGGSRFACVRYGNVVGSRGSVIPLFREQAKTGTLTLTHERMSRFWVTLPDVCEYVLRILDDMRGGEVFVPCLASARMTDIAYAIAPTANVVFTGIRPGEKVHELLLTPEETGRTRNHGWTYIVPPEFPFWQRDYAVGGSPVPAGWVYTSASAQRLTPNQLQEMLR